jgi:lysophospholipase L1-like esterase
MTRQRHFFFRHDPQLGWSHRPGVTCTFKRQVVRINSRGLRDDEIPHEKPPNEFRILCLGDSQLFGDGVAGEDTLPGRLETKLVDAQVINAGVIGYGTDQQLLFFRHQGRRYRPDVTIVTLNAYDFRDNISDRVRSGYRKPWYALVAEERLALRGVPVPPPDLTERADRWLNQSVCLYHFVRTRLRRGGRRSGEAGAASGIAPDVFPSPERMSEAVRVTERLLAAITAEAARAESRVVVAYLPYRLDFEKDLPYQKTARVVRAEIKRFSSKNNIAFLDLCDELEGRDVDGLFLDAMHLSAAGNDLVAQIIAERLTSLGLLPSRHRKE